MNQRFVIVKITLDVFFLKSSIFEIRETNPNRTGKNNVGLLSRPVVV